MILTRTTQPLPRLPGFEPRRPHPRRQQGQQGEAERGGRRDRQRRGLNGHDPIYTGEGVDTAAALCAWRCAGSAPRVCHVDGLHHAREQRHMVASTQQILNIPRFLKNTTSDSLAVIMGESFTMVEWFVSRGGGNTSHLFQISNSYSTPPALLLLPFLLLPPPTPRPAAARVTPRPVLQRLFPRVLRQSLC